MRFKLIVALVDDRRAEAVVAAARRAGATGATVITSVRGEGLAPSKTFLGLDLAGRGDVVLLVVEEHLSTRILEAIAAAGRFEQEPGSGIAIQLGIEDAVGLGEQIRALSAQMREPL
jgi:hypothetical protein